MKVKVRKKVWSESRTRARELRWAKEEHAAAALAREAMCAARRQKGGFRREGGRVRVLV